MKRDYQTNTFLKSVLNKYLYRFDVACIVTIIVNETRFLQYSL